MKCIVCSWLFPNETQNHCDQRPKSIERISTSVEDMKSFIEECAKVEGEKILFKSSLLHIQVMGTPEETFFKDDEITMFYDGDGFKFLESCLKNDSLGQCVAKQWHEGFEDQATYYLFQVRNIH
jgi:hypothetical protein